MTVAKSEVEGMTVFNKNKVDTKKQPMFFGAPLGVQRYDSYKYPVFDKLTQQQLGYFWRPEEVSLQKDRSDTTMPEIKAHFYQQSWVPDRWIVYKGGPGMLNLTAHLKLEACMTVWEFMEMIHSRSYTYIIKNVYSDPSEVFDTILDDEKVMSRAASTESYDSFIQHAHEYTMEPWNLLEKVVTSTTARTGKTLSCRCQS